METSKGRLIEKYKVVINPEIADDYFRYLINSVYKALTVFEGKDYKTRIVVYDKEVALKNFHTYIQNFLYEVSGSSKLFNTKDFIILLANLEEMLSISDGEHAKLRKLVFTCINTIEGMRDGD